MKQRKVAMFSYHTCPLASLEGKETGGMNVYIWELSQALGKRGWTIDVFTRSQDSRQPKVVSLMPNVRVVHLIAGPQKPFPKKDLLDFLPQFSKNFLKFVKEENLDYQRLHAHYYLSGLAALKANQGLHLPLVMTFHTLSLMKNLVARDALEREEERRIEAEFLLVKTAQKIIASSESDQKYLQYLYNCPRGKIVVINPGVNLQFFRPLNKEKAKSFIGADLEHKLILYAGRIEPLKGIDALLYALKILFVRHPKLRHHLCLWVVGGDVSPKPHLWSGERQKLEQLRKLLNIDTVVKFVGQRPQEELPYYYRAAEVLVMPSHYESFGMVALEAMACGVPVIATNVSGVASLIGKKEEILVSSASNPLLLASQIELLITNEKKQKQFGQQALKTVQNLTWEKVAQKVTRVYEEI